MGGAELQVSTQITVFMQKAIYYVSRLIAARGVLELTDRMINFEVASLDSSFGIKDVSIELTAITDIKIECGDLHPRIVIITGTGKSEFVLARGQELYDRLRGYMNSPVAPVMSHEDDPLLLKCRCGKEVNSSYRFCPWCGARM
jgi:hypothetical protein